MCMAESLCCPPETVTTLLIGSAAAKSLQSCLTLCDPNDGSPRGSPVPGILQARTLEWAAISFSTNWLYSSKIKSFKRNWYPELDVIFQLYFIILTFVNENYINYKLNYSYKLYSVNLC